MLSLDCAQHMYDNGHEPLYKNGAYPANKQVKLVRAFVEVVGGSCSFSQVRLLHAGPQPVPPRSTVARAKKRRDESTKGFSLALATFWGFTIQQKLSVVIGVLAALILLPKALLLVFVGVERALVGGVMAVESVVIAGASKLFVVASGVAAVGFLSFVTWSFVLPNRGK